MLMVRFLACILIVAYASAVEPMPIRVGDEWRHMPGGQWLSDLGAAWRHAGFDDRAWLKAPSGFAFSAYSYEATTLTEFDASRCHVFRRAFVIDDLAMVTWLVLRIDYSGGFVAWINGEEVQRRGLPGAPGTPVEWNTPAEVHTRGVPEEIDISEHKHVLVQGENVLAIQWHHSVNSSAYGTALVAELLVNFTRGPLVQNTSSRATTIVWKTLLPTDSKVEYGTSPSLGQAVVDSQLTNFHQITLSGLEPGTVYYYRIMSALGGEHAVSPIFTFRTLRESGEFSFAAMADMGLGSVPQYNIARVVEQCEPDLVLVAGDLVYPSYTAGREDFRFFSVYGPHMRGTPYFVVAGNHDTMIGSAADFFGAFCMPTNDVPAEDHALSGLGPEHYYSFDHGDAHFVGLYVPLMVGPGDLRENSPQFRWLEKDLATSSKPWKFIFLHHPVISSDGHRMDDFNGNGVRDYVELGNLLFSVAQKYGVQMIISGHDHVYTKFNPVGGVFAIVTGGGGGPLYWLSEFDPATAQFWRRYECIKVAGNSDELVMQALGEDGAVFDSLYIRRTPLPRRRFVATWGTPCVEDQPANDGDGNILNQRFDFVGTPIPTIPGKSSNIGRVWVNRDHYNLYLGFEQVMIYPGNVLFVFIEVPGIEGVNSLAGLGNNVIDPSVEGVDGLDFAGNLSFKNFRPSIGCILGDEYADGQFRSFKRPGSDFNTGQGVYRLDAGFTTLSGVRIQQYNRSPQLDSVPYEQDANFIEVSIPFSALGVDSAPGTIKLAAVVGGPDFLVNTNETSCFFDNSYLGLSMTGAGTAPVELEGVEVDLGPDLDEDGDGLLSEDEERLGTCPTLADTDGDGLPDGYEVKHGLNPLGASGDDGAEGDPDGDGMTNLAEYIAGTNPRDAKSVLKVEIEQFGPGTVLIWWRTTAGRAYRLEKAQSPNGVFMPVPGLETCYSPQPAVFSHLTEVPNGPNNNAEFYRVVVLP